MRKAMRFAIFLFLISSAGFMIAGVRYGHRLYDDKGVMNGCQSPGTDCNFYVPD